MAVDHRVRTSSKATHSKAPNRLPEKGVSSWYMGARRVSSIFSGSMVMVAGGPGALAIDGGWPGDDGGVGGLLPPIIGSGGRGWVTATPTPGLQCCLAETVAGGGVCWGEDGGVGREEVSAGGPPLRGCSTWSSRWVLVAVHGTPGTKG